MGRPEGRRLVVGLRHHDPAYGDRTDAGRAVARAMLQDARMRAVFDPELIAQGTTTPAPLVLALPRGGVPVAVPVAQALRAELGTLIVRRILVPNHQELAMGAVAASSGVTHTVRREDIVARSGVSDAAFSRAAEMAAAECSALAHRYGSSISQPEQRCVVLVDDGLATGATMTAAAELVSGLGVRRLVIAVPVAAPSAVRLLSTAVSGVVVVCPLQPADFRSVSQVYRDFSEPGDAELAAALGAPVRIMTAEPDGVDETNRPAPETTADGA